MMYAPHPPGIFDNTQIVNHGFSNSSEKGTPYFWVEFRTEHGSITDYFFITPKAAHILKHAVRAMGYRGTDFGELHDKVSLRGNLCQITVEQVTYKNQTRAKVKCVRENNSTGRPMHSDRAVEAARKLNALLEPKSDNDDENVPF